MVQGLALRISSRCVFGRVDWGPTAVNDLYNLDENRQSALARPDRHQTELERDRVLR